MLDCNVSVNEEGQTYIENSLGYSIKELESFPIYFHIENINTCNAQCIMCGIDFDLKSKKSMDMELFEKIASEISEYSNWVNKVMPYLDGEPLMDMLLSQKIRILKQQGIKRVNIATNASILNKKRSRELMSAGLDEIYIALDSMNEKNYNKIRYPLKYSQVFKNIIDLLNVREQMGHHLMVRMQMISLPDNKNETEEFIKYWKLRLRSKDQISIQRAHNWGNKIPNYELETENLNKVPCKALWGTMAVHVNGDVSLCCMDTTSEILLGNLERQTIREIWNDGRLAKIRKIHMNKQRAQIKMCDGCNLWRESKRELITI